MDYGLEEKIKNITKLENEKREIKEEILTTDKEAEREKESLSKRTQNIDKEIQVLKIEKANLTEGDIKISKERLQCVVHKGPIKAFTFICPVCGTFYCAKCYEVVKKLENACWSCKNALDPSKPVKVTDEKGKVIKKIAKSKPDSEGFYPKKAPKDFKPYKD